MSWTMTKVSSPTAWLNSDLRLFRTDELQYLPSAGVFRVMQRKDGWHVILYGHLPCQVDLLNDGATFEVLARGCMPPDVYHPDKVVMRFSNCRMVRRWIKHPVITSPSDIAIVKGYVELACDVELMGELEL